jgi:hypothetical protein
MSRVLPLHWSKVAGLLLILEVLSVERVCERRNRRLRIMVKALLDTPRVTQDEVTIIRRENTRRHFSILDARE